MKRNILLFAILMLCAPLGLMAQVADHCVAFSIGQLTTNSTLSPENARSIELKCTQIVTRSNAAKTALYSAFVIVPTIDVLGDRTVQAGTADITVVEAELTLVALNSVDNSKYGSVTVKIEGSGNSRARALNSLVQSITPTSGVFVNFIKKATAQIIDYYSNNMGRVLTQAQNLVAAERYEDALNFLNSIPICVPAFEQSSDAVASLFKMLADKNCSSAVTMATRYMSIGDYQNAQDVLLGVKAGSSCDAQIEGLLVSIKAKMDSTQALKPIEVAPAPAPAPAQPVAAPVVKQEEPTPTAVVVAAPVEPAKKEAGVEVKNSMKNVSFQFVDCKGNKADNSVEITITATNISDLRQEVYIPYSSSSMILYGQGGNSYDRVSASNRNFKLPTEMTRKIVFTVAEVGTKNSTVSFFVNFFDNEQGAKTVEFRNININWN